MERILWWFSILILIGTTLSQLNLASNGTASQSSNFQGHNAHLAITGGPTHDWSTLSCSATAERKQVAWWMLTFSSETVYISNVIIYYRSDTPDRLAGYSLFITNSSITTSDTSPPNDGHLCYHHNEEDLPDLVQNITCDHLGKRVIIYNERKAGVTYPEAYSDIALLELCDVQIIGCYKSWWGRGCRKPCPTYCTDHHCDPTNGTCIWGCNSVNCRNKECNNDGTCAVGCVKGQGGLFCNDKNVASDTVLLISDSPNQQASFVTDGDKTGTSCVTLSGTDSRLEIDTERLHIIQMVNVVLKDELSTSSYVLLVSNTSGLRLEETQKLPSDNIVEHTNPFNVQVHNLSSVIGRYVILFNTMGSIDICEVEIIGCPSGFYGESCDKKCPLNCDYPCHQKSGTCLFGCKDGYTGSTCDEACTPPRFGRLCSETCHCVNQPCYFISGTCPPGGCIEGWAGTSCSEDEITCRADNITRNVKYLPTKAFLYLNQNITFYCESGSYGTSVVSTCRENKKFIPPPPMCTDKTSSASAGVSLPVFVSVIAVITVIYTGAIVILLAFYRKNRTKKTGKKYEDIHIYSTCTSNTNTDVNVNAYELE